MSHLAKSHLVHKNPVSPAGHCAVLISAPPIPVGLRGLQWSLVEWDRNLPDSTGLHRTPLESIGLHQTPAGSRLENSYFIP
jgi:hypothetical protein